MDILERLADNMVFEKNKDLNTAHDELWSRKNELQHIEQYDLFLALTRKNNTKDNQKNFIYEVYGWIYYNN